MARQQKPAAYSNNWLGNTVTLAKVQEIGQDDKWHTLGECVDTPNAIKAELAKPVYKGHDVWIRNTFGERNYQGRI